MVHIKQDYQNTGKQKTYLHTWALCDGFDPWSFSTVLMTPTATVCFRSLAAKRPVEHNKDHQDSKIDMTDFVYIRDGHMVCHCT